MNIKYKHNRPAFTLIEILIAMTIGSVILLALYGIYAVSSKSYLRSTDQSELTQNARIALERISRDLRQAEEIATSLPPTNTDPLNPPATQILFQDGHNTTQIRYINYYLSGADLYRRVLHYSFSSDPSLWVKYNATDQYDNPPNEIIDENLVKADKISSLQFYGENTIHIDLIASNENNNFPFTTTIFARNK